MVKYTQKNNSGLKCFTVPSGKVVCAKKSKFKPYDINKDKRLTTKAKKKMMATRIQQRVRKQKELKKPKPQKPTAKGVMTIEKKIKGKKLKNKSTIKPLLTKSKPKPKPKRRIIVVKKKKQKKKEKKAVRTIVRKLESNIRVKKAKKIVRQKRAVALRKKQSDDEFREAQRTRREDPFRAKRLLEESERDVREMKMKREARDRAEDEETDRLYRERRKKEGFTVRTGNYSFTYNAPQPKPDGSKNWWE
tara:strand:+ start:162 stop:905 length:744 start_codon:yes stop_codon:yes gene_type:complete